MSFWSRLSKRVSSVSEGADIGKLLYSIIHDAEGVPDKVIDSIIATTASPPDSSEERNSDPFDWNLWE
ncbi:hypothetical protein BDR07DRAFT_1398011 [Suillus spraguei]|nr:hypothetical protein BDR07DRAFT_1398011 [Suillus spraguei]